MKPTKKQTKDCHCKCPEKKYNKSINGKFPLVKGGTWKYKSVNYTLLTPGTQSVRFDANFDLRFIDQHDGFIFIENVALNTNNIATWKKEATGYTVYGVQDRNDNGVLIVSPSKYDDNNNVIQFKGVFVEAGFLTGSTVQEPAVGQVKITWKSL